ncbi:hypothetical protein WJ32_13500 [Burkholderia ubonensis]|uniref:Uncharacterized protein n=1 Tax=Burkholderia ubonensis TaxID=101571 RepID=A0A103QSQ5_9BURK|nr:hypothetical protein WJ32_13500 [Burkholderia ubonensis]KVG54884.1 hypothetical protein WJ33_01050 [Burkholderia ubonensis]
MRSHEDGAQLTDVPACVRAKLARGRQLSAANAEPDRWRFATEERCYNINIDLRCVRQIVEVLEVLK